MDNLIEFKTITRLQLSKKILATIKATQRELERAVKWYKENGSNLRPNCKDVPIQVKHSYVCFPEEDKNLRYLVDGMETQDLVELCDDVILSISSAPYGIPSTTREVFSSIYKVWPTRLSGLTLDSESV